MAATASTRSVLFMSFPLGFSCFNAGVEGQSHIVPQGILHRHLEPWLTDNYFVTRARAAKHVELAAIDRGCVKTRYRLDFGGASTIPGTKQIEYEASYEVVFNWHGLGSAFSHGLDLQETFVVLAAQRQFSEWSGRTARELTEYSSANADTRCPRYLGRQSASYLPLGTKSN